MNTYFLPFAFMYYCGLRPSEARDIRKSDIIEIGGKKALHLRGAKTVNAVRDIPIVDDLSRLIEKSLKSRIRGSQGYICNWTVDVMRGRWNVKNKI